MADINLGVGGANSAVAGGYDIDNSLKFEADNSEYIYRTPSSAGNRKTWTLSFWLKRTELADGSNTMRIFEAWDGSTGTSGLFTATDNFILDLNNGSNYFTSSAVFRDTSAWYHFVIRVDTTSGTASERARVYVNGSELAGSWNSNIGQNTDLTWNQNVAHNFARFHNNDSFVSGYYAEIINVDGTSLAPTAFGEVDSDSGIWKPINASPTYGTNGFKLEFKSSGSLGADTSGNGHTWTLNNITSADQATDTPTNNFCTINPLVDQGFAIWSLTEGGTRGANVGGNCAMVGTFGVSSGKWYWEGVTTSFSGTNYWQWGVMPIDAKQGNSADSMGDAGTAWYSGDNAFYTSTSQSGQSPTYNTGFSGYTAGDVWSISLNCDVSPYEMTIRINNSVPGTVANNTNRSVGTYTSARPVFPYIRLANNASDNTWHNFGNPFISTLSGGNTDENGYGDFKYAPPSGYYALCTKNLAEYG
jgi:hypothetical protein